MKKTTVFSISVYTVLNLKYCMGGKQAGRRSGDIVPNYIILELSESFEKGLMEIYYLIIGEFYCDTLYFAITLCY